MRCKKTKPTIRKNIDICFQWFKWVGMAFTLFSLDSPNKKPTNTKQINTKFS